MPRSLSTARVPVALALLAALAGLAAPAHATATVNGRTWASMTDAAGTHTTASDPLLSALPGGGHRIESSANATYSVSDGVLALAGAGGWAEATEGTLRAYVNTELIKASNPLNPSLPNLVEPHAFGLFGGAFNDQIVVNGNGLAAGTPVDFVFDIRCHINVPRETRGGAFDFNTSLWSNDGLASYQLDRSSPWTYQTPDYNTTYTVGQDYGFDYPVTLSTTVGATINLQAALTVGIDQGWSNQGGGGEYWYNHGTLDASHTARLFLDPLTSGVTLDALSGHDYSINAVAPVPEPGSLAMLGFGLGGLGWVARRRRGAMA
ncbi:PEP-CTERM sorting domain-containing protein [Derxia gummosa]|uniref:PEP-CTERM sorting domain-containing protein n=1 Tax=Derxia gummosa DSM 723 TaxID=1121388 RepID=A0A9U5C6D3_9BURK|nr:PEP-CTERM sorting domain-containing protein [Derxia gummosa]